MEISLTPNGALVFERQTNNGPIKRPTEASLLKLAQQANTSSLAFDFWRRFSILYLTQLCHIPELQDQALDVIEPSPSLQDFVAAAPPMKGGEYLNLESLQKIWVDLDKHARREISKFKGGLSKWLNQTMPEWNRMGRVCFHLAENKNDPDDPFAFLATYSTNTGQKALQHLPLAQALIEFSSAKNKKILIQILSPVHKAAKALPWVHELVESGDIFHPLAWTPQDAWALLRDLTILDRCGVLVRTPNWWKQRTRPQVKVSIGEKKNTTLNHQALLNFNVSLSLGGEELSAEEEKTLLQGSDSLIYLKGQWVELGGQQLKQTLDHWKAVKKTAGDDGLSFIEGMRLLAGASADMHSEPDPEQVKWTDIRPGKWLKQQLIQMKQQDKASLLPGKALKATLRPYQRRGAQWLAQCSALGLGVCLADDMGLGKTIQVIALLLTRKRKKLPKNPSLIVVPTSLLENWKSEIERFAPTLKITLLHSSYMKKSDLIKVSSKSQFLKNTDLLITSYGMVLKQTWLQNVDWDLLILDEAQAIKNPGSKQSRAIKKLKGHGRIALTGTPVENKLSDLWSLFDFLSPGLLSTAKTFQRFVQRLKQRPSQPYAPLRKLTAPYILRRLKTDKSIISDLPEKTEVYAYCKLSKKQAAHYSRAVDELSQTLHGSKGIKRRGLVLTFILRFKQICNHPAQWLSSPAYPVQDSGKFLRLKEICEELAERQEKVLLFTQFKSLCKPLSNTLQTIFGRPGLELHGATPAKKRKALVDTFQQEDGPPFFVLSLKAGGTGLNLTQASHVIHFDRWWNPAVENQATDRAFRIGQKKNVLVHKFVCSGTIEERIDKLIGEKNQLANALIDAGSQTMLTELSDDEIIDLVQLDLKSAVG
jgi:SNF2 family DNA or RNA helicase